MEYIENIKGDIEDGGCWHLCVYYGKLCCTMNHSDCKMENCDNYMPIVLKRMEEKND